MGSRPSADSRAVGLAGDSVDNPSAEEVVFKTPNDRGLYAANIAVFEGQGIRGSRCCQKVWIGFGYMDDKVTSGVVRSGPSSS